MEELPARPVIPVIAGAQGVVGRVEAAELVKEVATDAPDTGAFIKLISQVAALSDVPLFKDSRAELLIDGPITYQAMLGAIERAKRVIYLETFIFSDDEVGQQFANALLDKARDGIEVYVIYDSLGSADSDPGFFKTMKEAGIKIIEYHKINPLDGGNLLNVNERDHRKLMVVDGKVAFTGGVNISGTHSNSSPQGSFTGDIDNGWRDTHIQIFGPAVQGFQRMFQKHWVSQGGSKDVFQNHGINPTTAGDELIAVLQTKGDDGKGSSIYTAYIEAMKAARNEIWITQAYFSPDRRFLDQLADAAQRGVDVRVLLPGITDSSLVLHASRSRYGDLLRAGVKVYERTSSVLHAKTAVIDGVWSTVGSSNLDYRSFLHNDEINAVIFGTGFAEQMKGQFMADIKDAKPIMLKQWKKRPAKDRLKEVFSRLLQFWI